MNAKTLFIGLRFESCKVFCDVMANYGYKTDVVSFKGTFIDRKKKEISVRRVIILPDNKVKALEKLGKLLKQNNYKLVFSAGFPFILPKEFFYSKTLFVNSHPHLLPKFKGNNVIKESFKRKDTACGVTAHVMTSKVDAGKILVKRKIHFATKTKADQEMLYQLLFGYVEPAVVVETLGVLKEKKRI